jgi:hypothetical protein
MSSENDNYGLVKSIILLRIIVLKKMTNSRIKIISAVIKYLSTMLFQFLKSLLLAVAFMRFIC